MVASFVAACSVAPGAPTPPRPGASGSQESPGGPSTASATAVAGGPQASLDACALLSDQELEAATGRPVLSQSPSTLTRVFPSVCDIELDAGGSLTIGIMSSGGRAMYENSFEPFIGEGDNPPLDEAVEGLGDKAGISHENDIMVLKGDVLFDIFWVGAARSDRESVLRYLAEAIVAKLPCLAAGCPGLTLPPPPSRPPVFDVCSLLTSQEIADATDLKALDGEAFVGMGGDTGCAWALETDLFPGNIELTVRDVGGREQFDFWAGAFDPPLEHLPGLGDDAIKTATVPDGSVYAVVGDRLLTLEFSLPLSVDDPYSLVLPLVETALSRL